MNEPALSKDIAKIHASYQIATGFKVSLRYDRESAWQYFLNDGFTESDLLLVIVWLQREIKAGRRWESSLFFRNLVVQRDRFEEDLAVARAHARKPEPTARDKALEQLRPTASPTTVTTTASVKHGKELAIAALENLKREIAK